MSRVRGRPYVRVPPIAPKRRPLHHAMRGRGRPLRDFGLLMHRPRSATRMRTANSRSAHRKHRPAEDRPPPARAPLTPYSPTY